MMWKEGVEYYLNETKRCLDNAWRAEDELRKNTAIHFAEAYLDLAEHYLKFIRKN